MLSNCNACLPAVEIKQTEKDYVITMELPGSTRDDIKVWNEKNVLTITGEKKAPEGDRILGERSFGRFTRSFRLPEDADCDKIEAGYKDGVVTVQIAKLEDKKPKDIKIQ